MPRLETENTVQDIVDYARSRGFNVDPKALGRRGGDLVLCRNFSCQYGEVAGAPMGFETLQ